MYRMHGYSPGAVEPTTELLDSHRHPDDHDDLVARIVRAGDVGQSFSSRHRVLDTAGVVHSVMLVAGRIYDDSRAVVGTAGLYVDLTDTLAENERDTFGGAVA